MIEGVVGILGISVDGHYPALAAFLQRRSEGRDGEGMGHLWMSGKALAYRVLGKDVNWLLDLFRITEKKWKKAKYRVFSLP